MSGRHASGVPTSLEPASGPAPVEGGRIVAVQGLRALSIVLVLAYHAGLPLPGGFVGVDVFFVISGFVIARLLLRRAETTGRVDLLWFYRRRVRRLLPALAVMLTIVTLASALIVSPLEAQGNTAITAVGASAWLGNVALYYVTSGYFSPDAHYATLLHTWSLAVEEQFYVVFPLLVGLAVLLTRRRGRSPRGVLAVVVVAMAVLSLLINVWLCYGEPAGIPAPTGVAFFMPFSRAWEFAAGILVALAVTRPARFGGRAPRVVAALGLGLCVVSAVALRDTLVWPGLPALLPVTGAAMVLWGVARDDDGTAARLLSTPRAVRLGDLSYSVYLWHWPFVVFGVALISDHTVVRTVATALSVPVALLSHRLVEEPIRHRDGKVWRLVTSSIAAPVAAALLLGFGASASWGNAAVVDIKDQTQPRTYVQAACDTSTEMVDDVEVCRRPAPAGATGRPVVLIGDSNAQQYGNALAAATEELGREYVVSVGPGCSIVELDVVSSAGVAPCTDRTRTLLRWLESQPSSVVVVGSSNVLVDDPDIGLRRPDGEVERSRAAKARAWQQSLTETYTRLRAAGHTVISVRAIPHFRDDGVVWSPGSCSMPLLTFAPKRCNIDKSLTEGDREHRTGLAAEEAAEAASGAAVLDVRPQVCPDGRCAARRGDLWVYREGMHLTEGMSERLAPQFTEAVRAAG